MSRLRVDVDSKGIVFARLEAVSRRLTPTSTVPELNGVGALAVESAIRQPGYASELARVRTLQRVRAYGRALFGVLADALGRDAIQIWLRSECPILEVGASSEVAALAWELLLPDDEDESWFCLNGDVLRLSHGGPTFATPRPSETDSVLLLTARPHLDQDVGLDVIARVVTSAVTGLRWLPFASRTRLRELDLARPRFLHLDLHGVVLPPEPGSPAAGPRSVLLLNGEQGSDPVAPSELLLLLSAVHPQFLVATSCQSSLLTRVSADQQIQDLAAAASGSSIDAVVASRRSLTPAEGAQFCDAFYHAIADGGSVAGAVRAARNALVLVNGGAGILTAASFTLTWVGSGDSIATSLLAESVPMDLSTTTQLPIVPMLSEILRQIELGDRIVAVQADPEEASACVTSLRSWASKLLPPVRLAQDAVCDVEGALLALSRPIGDSLRIHDWTTTFQNSDYLSSSGAAPLGEMQHDGVDLVFMQGFPSWLGDRIRGRRVVELPAAPRTRYPDSEDLAMKDPEAVSVALSTGATGRWLLRRGPDPLLLNGVEPSNPDAKKNSHSPHDFPEPLRSLADGLPVEAVLYGLAPFSTGILLPRADDPDWHRVGASWSSILEVARRALLTGDARAIEGPRARLIVFEEALGSSVIDTLWSAGGFTLPLNLWVEAELSAAAPGFRYGHPDPSPDHGVLRDRLLDVAHMSGDEVLYKMVAARNRVMYCLLHGRQNLRPDKRWPGSEWFTKDDLRFVKAIESSCSEMPERPDAATPRPVTKASIKLVHNAVVIFEGEQAESDLIDLPDWARNINDFMIDLNKLTPVQHATFVLEQGPNRGSGIYQPIQLWRSAMMAVLLTSGSDNHEAAMRRTVTILAEDKWSEDAVHLQLEGSRIASDYIPAAAEPLMLEALAAALSDGTTHSTGHALEILMKLANRATARGDTNLRRMRLSLAARLALTRDWSRFPRQLDSLIAAFADIDVEEASRLFQQTHAVGEDDERTMRQAQFLIATGELGLARLCLDSLRRETLTPAALSHLLTADLQMDLAVGQPLLAVERTGGQQSGFADNLTGRQLLLRGRALAQLGAEGEAQTAWGLGTHDQQVGGECAVALLTSLLRGGDFERSAALSIDYNEYRFPFSARVAYLRGIAHLAQHRRSDLAAELLRVGLWSSDIEDLSLATQVLEPLALKRLSELEQEVSTTAGRWLLGDTGAGAPFPDLDVEAFEVARLMQFTQTAAALLTSCEDPAALWADYLDEQTRRAKHLADLLWDNGHRFRSRRHFLQLVDILEYPRLAPVRPAQQRKARCVYAIAALSRSLGEYQDAIRFAETAVDAALGIDDAETVKLSQNLIGNSYYDLGEYELAADYQWRSLGPLGKAHSLQALLHEIFNGPATQYQTVLSLFNYGNSLVKLQHRDALLARFAAATAFYKLSDPQSTLAANHRQEIVNQLASNFKPQPPRGADDSIAEIVIRHLHEYATRHPST